MDTECTILVAEDDELIREIMCEVLEDHGLRPAPASSTAEALRLLEEPRSFAAAFLDIDLGDRGGGYTVARRLRETHPQARIVYTSGGSRLDYEREHVDGAVFVQKPYLPDRVVRTLIDGPAERR